MLRSEEACRRSEEEALRSEEEYDRLMNGTRE